MPEPACGCRHPGEAAAQAVQAVQQGRGRQELIWHCCQSSTSRTARAWRQVLIGTASTGVQSAVSVSCVDKLPSGYTPDSVIRILYVACVQLLCLAGSSVRHGQGCIYVYVVCDMQLDAGLLGLIAWWWY